VVQSAQIWPRLIGLVKISRKSVTTRASGKRSNQPWYAAQKVAAVCDRKAADQIRHASKVAIVVNVKGPTVPEPIPMSRRWIAEVSAN
jgi:hypothetical protein